MAFRIQNSAKKWFEFIGKGKGFDIDFDMIYFCFMAGITTNRKKQETTSDTTEVVSHFPGRYQERGKILVALFLTRELRDLGIDMSEKQAVHSTIIKLINPESPDHLSDEGLRQFNRYIYGGFDVLCEWFDERPRTMEVFLRTFKSKVDQIVNQVSI